MTTAQKWRTYDRPRNRTPVRLPWLHEARHRHEAAQVLQRSVPVANMVEETSRTICGTHGKDETKMKDVKNGIEIEQFIYEYLKTGVGTDRLDAEFHDQFSEKFGGKRLWYPFGSNPNLIAMKWLKKLYDQGALRRHPIGLHAHETGFPNWVYSYSLRRYA